MSDKIKLNSNELGRIMDLVDVKDELIALKDYYEHIVQTTDDNATKYKASYSAVALAEASNVIMHYLRNPKKGE